MRSKWAWSYRSRTRDWLDLLVLVDSALVALGEDDDEATNGSGSGDDTRIELLLA